MASRILIVKLSSMGDVVHTLPAAQALRARYPDAHLGWVVERPHAELLRGQPFLDAVHVWDRKNLRTFAQLIRQLRQTPWDVAIDFQGLFRSAVIGRLSGARRRIGYVPVRELAHWFYTDPVERGTLDLHAVERSIKLVQSLGATWDQPAHERPYVDNREAGPGLSGAHWFPLWPNSTERSQVGQWLDRQGFDPQWQRLVILNPHCRKDANRWPSANYAALAARLLERDDLRVAVSGAGSTRELCDEIAAPLPPGALWRADGQFGLLGATELFTRADAIVTGDTGPMHLAVAAETPVVALFGPANSLRTGPYTGSAIVLDHHLECAPCFANKTCPLGFDPPRCLAEISVDEVYRAVLRQLAIRRDPRQAAAGPPHTHAAQAVTDLPLLPPGVGEGLR